MSSISDILSQSVRKVLLNQCLAKATLAINAGGAATIKTTGTTPYTVNGVHYTKAALAAQSMAPTHDFSGTPVAQGVAAFVQPANTTVFYVVALNAAGTVAIVQGSYAGQTLVYPADLSKTVLGSGLIPTEPSGYTAIGVVKVATGAVTFTPGTTLLDAANVTATYFDVEILPETL